MAARHPGLLDLFASAVLAVRPHTSGVVLSCATSFGAVTSQVVQSVAGCSALHKAHNALHPTPAASSIPPPHTTQCVQVGARAWADPALPLPAAYAALMHTAGGAGGAAALQAMVAALPAMASTLGPGLAQSLLMPPLMALLPARLSSVRCALAREGALARLAYALPPAGAAQLLCLLPALCELDEGKEAGRQVKQCSGGCAARMWQHIDLAKRSAAFACAALIAQVRLVARAV